MLMKFSCIFLLVLAPSIMFDLCAQSLNSADKLAFDQRSKAVLDLFDVSPAHLAKCQLKQAGYLIGAMVAKNSPKSDINAFAIRLIENGNEQQLINRGFDYAPLMDAYIRWNNYYTDETKSAFKHFFTTQSGYKTSGTYNEVVMLATARFFVSQVWGEDNLPDSTAFKKDDRNAKKYLMKEMNDLVYMGMKEYGSNPYAPFPMGCFLSLADLSTDLEVKNMASIAYEVVLAQSIVPSLQGNYMAATGRSYPDVWLGDTDGTMLMSYVWPYIGLGGISKNNYYIMILPCVSNYRLPNNLYQIATNRKVKEVIKTNFQNKFQYSYLNKNFGIYSQQEPGNTGAQAQRSGVLWVNNDNTKSNLLWITNPMWDDFLMVRQRHTHGMTGFERIAQFEGTTVHTYNIPNSETHSDGKIPVAINKYALGWVPGSYLAKIDNSSTSGRIFLHYGKVLIAITATKKFEWNASVPPSSFNSPSDIKSGDSQFKVEGLQFGVAIETADPDEYSGTAQAQLEAFKKDIIKQNIGYDVNSLTTTYTDRSGNIITCSFNGGDRINNVLIAYDNSWGILNCKGVFQLPNNNLTITYKNEKTVYDFVNWKIIK
ncbi:MAG: hypothetical protein WCK18_07255 [Prolixibacteraceae bacterium]